MSELKKTMSFAGTAAALALLALGTTPRPKLPDAFADRGEAFFPDFKEASAAATMEVVAFDEETGAAKAFKVENNDGRWTIPSHHGYPADGKERLAKTAAGVIDIRKDDFRSDNGADHAALGVIDPLDEGATSGKGQRVTLKDKSGAVLADFIIGGRPEEREGMRFVRLPGQKRVFAARMDVDISTRFEDWIERDLLAVERADIESIVIHDYSIDENTGLMNERDVVSLAQQNGAWQADRMSATQEVDSAKMNELLTALDDLKIAGVRPKPEGLSASLTRGGALSQPAMLSLQSRGYYFTRDGRLVSNEGELRVETKAGVLYTLRFGEVVYGTGDELSAGGVDGDPGRPSSGGGGENRFLFITAEFRSERFPEPPRPADMAFAGKAEAEWTDADRRNKALQDAHQAWQSQTAAGRQHAAELNARFAGWYYVIAADNYGKVHLTRRELVKAKAS